MLTALNQPIVGFITQRPKIYGTLALMRMINRGVPEMRWVRQLPDGSPSAPLGVSSAVAVVDGGKMGLSPICLGPKTGEPASVRPSSVKQNRDADWTVQH